MSHAAEKLHRSGRYSGVREKPHGGSGVQRVELVFGKNGRVSEGLPDVLEIEVWQVCDDLSGRHAVRHEIHDMRHRDAKAPNGRPTRQHIRVLRDAVEVRSHLIPRQGV